MSIFSEREIVFIGEKEKACPEKILDLKSAGRPVVFVENIHDLISQRSIKEVGMLIFLGIVNFLKSMESLGCNLSINKRIPLVIVDSYRPDKMAMKHLNYMLDDTRILFCHPDELCAGTEGFYEKFNCEN